VSGNEFDIFSADVRTFVLFFYPAMFKSSKQPNFLKRVETSVVLIVFNGVICEDRSITGSYRCPT
jgi:hypothetical protein